MKKFISIILSLFLLIVFPSFETIKSNALQSGEIISCIVDPMKSDIKLFYKNSQNQNFGSLGNLKTWLEANGTKLLFAMNGGMYMTDQSPLGLFIENGKSIQKLNTRTGAGNFYLQPNGVFYLTDTRKAFISSTSEFKSSKHIQYATQSGPMLVIDGKINSQFNKESRNYNIRNGVGILPGNKILFAISSGEVNFYDFADFFQRAGCKNALYLDGFVSRAYIPEKKHEQLDGNFGVIIGVTERK